MPGNQHSAEGALDRLAQAVHQRPRGCRAGAESLGDLRPVQAVPVGQIQDFAVTVGQPGRGLRDQRRQLRTCGQRFGPGVIGGRLGKLVGNLFAPALPNPAERLITGDSVQPGPQLAEVTQTGEPRGGGAESVLNAVGRRFAITQHTDAEIEEAIGITIVDFGERTPVTGDRRLGQLGITHIPVG